MSPKAMLKKNILVVGLGYVGLPLVLAATKAEYSVTGLDKDLLKTASLTGGRSPFKEIENYEIEQALRSGTKFTSSIPEGYKYDIAVICVPTPLDQKGLPDLKYVQEAASTLGSCLTPGALVILESTTYPGTTEEILIPILEEKSGLKVGQDFSVAYSPERIDPGNKKYNLENTPKVIGGFDQKSSLLAEEFYKSFISSVTLTSGLKEAETAKLLENTYRHINIALVNEMAIFCHDMGIDIWSVISAAATKPFGFEAFYPGPGVGGHCIPIDPSYLSYKVKAELGYPFKFVELAQSINARMPKYVFDRSASILARRSKVVARSKILLIGMTYKLNSEDIRESPSIALSKLLLDHGASIDFIDNLAPKSFEFSERMGRIHSLSDNARDYDLIIVLQPHDDLDLTELKNYAEITFDTRNYFEGSLKGMTRL